MKKTLSYIGFWLISLTWGCIMTTIGAIVALILLVTGHRPYHVGPNIYFKVGKNWGGLELGPFFLVDDMPGRHTVCHECGHGIQNCIWGPLMPFVVSIPSAIRYWLRDQREYNKKMKFIGILEVLILVFNLLTILIPVLCSNGWLFIIPGLITIYLGALSYWLWYKELPQYESRPYPLYDDIWFEGQASDWGERVYGLVYDKE